MNQGGFLFSFKDTKRYKFDKMRNSNFRNASFERYDLDKI